MALGSANPLLLATAASGGDSDPVTRSLRFDDGNNSSLYRATGSTDTTWTVSMWVKRCKLGDAQYLFSWGGDGIRFDDDDKLALWNGAGYSTSTAVFRDTSSWYHLTISCNSNVITVYVNGATHTMSEGSSHTYPAWGNAYFGKWSANNSYNFDGYLADIYGIEGSALDHTSFTSSNSYGGLKPASYTGSFGANGFHLKLDDSSDIGADSTSNSNDFTATNLSSHDVMLDTPTKNYCTLNPLDDRDTPLSEGNLRAGVGSTYSTTAGTFGMESGKWIWSTRINGTGGGTPAPAMLPASKSYSGRNVWAGASGEGWSYALSAYSDLYYDGSVLVSNLFSASDEGEIAWAVDIDAGKAWLGTVSSGSVTWYNSGDPANGTNATFTFTAGTAMKPAISSYGSGSDGSLNFGQDATYAGLESPSTTYADSNGNGSFGFQPPNGFLALCSDNLDDPTVTPSEHFGILTYSGNSSSNARTGLGFQPDLLWTKSRSTSGSSPKWFDSLRGVTKRLETDTSSAETTQSTELSSFDNDGFTLGSGSGSNYSGRTYVAWSWKAHQSTSSGSGSTTTYTVKVEDNSGDAWDYSGSFVDGSNFPTLYMELFENREDSLVSLGSVAVRSYDDDGNDMSDYSEQTYTLECADLDAIAVKWHYDTTADGDEYDTPSSYNDYLNDQKITILDGTTSEWTTNNYSNDDGTDYNYSPPTGWADGDTLKSATTSYDGSDTATLTSDSGSSGPTEKYNAAAGFTIISYSGDGYMDGDTQTLDHSLGVPLEFVMAKARTSNDGQDNGDWIVWHKDLGDYEYLFLNSSSAKRTESSDYDLIDTDTSGTQHQVIVNNGTDSSSSNYHYLNSGPYSGSDGEDYILYGWAGVEGYSKFGTYSGAGTNGVFVYTGHRPKMVWIKNIDSSANWMIFDAVRDTYNVTENYLIANNQNSEATNTDFKLDILSNGFYLFRESTAMNNSAYDYVFCSWAESPLKHANAR